MSDKKLGVLLACFDDPRAASKAHRSLESGVESKGGKVLDTVVFRVNEKKKASVWDPRRTALGTASSAITWGLFGLVAGTNRLLSMVIWAVLGAICGGLNAYFTEHLLAKDELARLGKRLPAKSSAVCTFAEITDPGALLQVASDPRPSISSAASINDDLSSQVLGDSPGQGQALLSMIMVRYGDRNAAKKVASGLAAGGSNGPSTPQVELVIETDAGGRRHVADPKQGVRAMGRSDIISWGGFGLVFGAIVGFAGGGGILGFLQDGAVTGIAWAIFGLFAGMLYGLWAGRAVSARRLKGVGPILAPGTSLLLAWADGQIGDGDLERLGTSQSRQAVLVFRSTEGGAILDAA